MQSLLFKFVLKAVYLMKISKHDKQILRDLAKKQLEMSQLPEMQHLKKEWTLHNDCKGKRPMITIELDTFSWEIIFPLLRCEGDTARAIEAKMHSNMVNFELFHDDTPVLDYFPVYYDTSIKPFDIEVKTVHSKSDQSSLGHQFVETISDLQEDFHLLKKSSFSIKKDAHIKKMNMLKDIFGDILPVKLTGQSLYCTLTQNLLHIMGMENMFFALMDYPHEVNTALMMLADDYIEYFKLLESEGLILPTTGGELLRQGSFCYTEDLPGYDEHNKRVFTSKDIWGFMDSQETVGVDPEIFKEIIFPAYKKVAENFGLLSYGCCEPVDTIWESCISKLDNLRKVSISPWCNEEYMGNQLCGKKIIYHRKPSPNFLGVGKDLDEDAVRSHIQKTVQAAKGCTLEFSQRDVYQINNSPNKVKRYVEIIREECENF